MMEGVAMTGIGVGLGLIFLAINSSLKLKRGNMRIVLSSHAVRFYTNDGWTFEQIVKLAPDTRIIFFNDKDPYFIADRVDVDALMKYSPEPCYAFHKDKNYTVRENIESRNL